MTWTAGQRITASQLNKEYTQADTNSTTVTSASLVSLSSVYVIPANDATAGTVYRMTAYGQGTWGATAQALTFSGLLAAGTGLGSGTIPSGNLTTSQTFRWICHLNLVVSTSGSGGTAVGNIEAQIYTTSASTGQSGRVVGCAGSVSMDTTINRNLQIQANWGAITGAPTLTCLGTIFQRGGA